MSSAASLANVAVVVVSHSPLVAQGAADMARQMVGRSVRVSYCGGGPDGDLGTDVAKIKDCIDQVYGPPGVVMLVDLGGAEMNAEMAIEMLPPHDRPSVVICNAPIVEGTVMAAAEASVGGSLAEVKQAAEEAT